MLNDIPMRLICAALGIAATALLGCNGIIGDARGPLDVDGTGVGIAVGNGADGGAGAGSSDDSDGGAARDGEADGGSDAGMDAGMPPPKKPGAISISQLLWNNGMTEVASGGVTAYFDVPPSPVCNSHMEGPCEVASCTSSTTVTSDSAGTITISGESNGSIALAYGGSPGPAWGPYGWETPGTGLPPLWNDGQPLTISTTGDQVPAFSVTIPAPGGANLMAPACASNNCGTIPMTQDLTVAWSGNPSVVVNLSSRIADASIAIVCVFTSSPGVVPASALRYLGATSLGYQNSLFFSSMSSTTLDVGEYGVFVGVYDQESYGTFTTGN
jgi:hypothetical protein